MATYKVARGGKHSPGKIFVLLLILIGAGLAVFIPIEWAYQEIDSGMGAVVAQITVTFAIVFLSAIVLAGMCVGYLIDRAIKKQRLIFRSPQPGGWVDRLIGVWGFVLVEEQPAEGVQPRQAQSSEAEEALAMLSRPRRRGRKPTYSIDRWKRIVFKWENRDPLRDTMTLADLLAEEFGTHADGSPRMTEQSYYDWRDRVFAELKKEAESAGIAGKNPRGRLSAHNQ